MCALGGCDGRLMKAVGKKPREDGDGDGDVEVRPRYSRKRRGEVLVSRPMYRGKSRYGRLVVMRLVGSN
jgi:hypothetical protein